MKKVRILCSYFINYDKITVFFFNFAGQLYGIEKYWAFLKYYKNGDKLKVEPRLRDHLNKFNTIEDFRVLEPEINEMLQGVGSLRTSPDKRRYRSLSESEGAAKAVPRSIGRQDGRENHYYNRKR